MKENDNACPEKYYTLKKKGGNYSLKVSDIVKTERQNTNESLFEGEFFSFCVFISFAIMEIIKDRYFCQSKIV